jgi:hypothetical protein
LASFFELATRLYEHFRLHAKLRRNGHEIRLMGLQKA